MCIMDGLIETLQQHIEIVDEISNKIEFGENYLEQIKSYLPSLNEMMKIIFELKQNSQIGLQIDWEFVMQVLTDIVYGIEQEDTVFLLDVLRYGLLEIYYYVGAEVQGEA